MGDPGAARFIIDDQRELVPGAARARLVAEPRVLLPAQEHARPERHLLAMAGRLRACAALGADPFLAYQLVLVFSSALGFATFYVLVRTLWRPADRARPARGGGLRVLELPSTRTRTTPSSLACCCCRRSACSGSRRGAPRYGALAGVGWGAGFGALRARRVLDVLRRLLRAPRRSHGGSRSASSCAARDVREDRRRVATGWLARRRASSWARCPPRSSSRVTFLPALRSSGGYKLQSAYFFRPTSRGPVNVGRREPAVGLDARPRRRARHATLPRARLRRHADLSLLALARSPSSWRRLERAEHRARGGRRYSSASSPRPASCCCSLPMAGRRGVPLALVYWLPGASGIRASTASALSPERWSSSWPRRRLRAARPVAPRQVPRAPSSSRVRRARPAVCLEQVNVTTRRMLSGPQQLALLYAHAATAERLRELLRRDRPRLGAHPARVQTTAMLL